PLTNKVDVQFSEPVDATSSQVAGNYAFSGPSPRTVTAAVRDATTPSLVHLTISAAIGANAAFYGITVTNGKELAINTRLATGTTYEPGSNRFIRLSSDSGATVSIPKPWGDLNPADFTDKPMDVIFRVKATPPYLIGNHTLWLDGSEAPLSFTRPGLLMKDDGV